MAEEKPVNRWKIGASRDGTMERASIADDQTSIFRSVVWRIVDFIVAAIFIYAGALKILDPVQFAHDIDNYKMLPWRAAVALAFYLPWLEIFSGLALIFRRFYNGALAILTALVVVFLVATVMAKARGLDITCGCFGHASQHWSFPVHLTLDLALLGALIALCLARVSQVRG